MGQSAMMTLAYVHSTIYAVVVLHRSIVIWCGGQLPCQLTIGACYTITPHQSHILQHAHILMTD